MVRRMWGTPCDCMRRLLTALERGVPNFALGSLVYQLRCDKFFDYCKLIITVGLVHQKRCFLLLLHVSSCCGYANRQRRRGVRGSDCYMSRLCILQRSTPASGSLEPLVGWQAGSVHVYLPAWSPTRACFPHCWLGKRSHCCQSSTVLPRKDIHADRALSRLLVL